MEYRVYLFVITYDKDSSDKNRKRVEKFSILSSKKTVTGKGIGILMMSLKEKIEGWFIQDKESSGANPLISLLDKNDKHLQDLRK